ncbi:MAG: hypothetical protein RSE61_02480 [Anaerovoracaceae bacterium]
MDLINFKKRIGLTAIFIVLLVEIFSLLFCGVKLRFTVGLMVGVIISIINFEILINFSRKVIIYRNVAKSTVGFIIRMTIFAISFLICAKVSMTCGVGWIIGMVSHKLGIFYQSIRNK